MKKLGQHFLKNAAILEKIVDAIALADGDRVIEIGPGHGELTAPLALASRGLHCNITGIEKDHSLIEKLELFGAQENSVGGGAHINIIEGDALTLLPGIVKTLAEKTPGYKIVGNIPYYITGKLLRTIGELENKPLRTVLLIQKEVAERICAAPPAMNRLAASVQFWADTKIVAMASRKDFSPPPEVDSAVIALTTKDFALRSMAASPAIQQSIDPALYYRAVRALFAQPGKTLLNNIRAAAPKTINNISIAQELKKIDVHPGARPHDTTIEQIITIALAPIWG